MDVWEMDVRRFGAALPLAVLHAQARERGLRDLLRHPLPRPRAPGRPPAAGLERLRLAPRARRGVRREVGLGARQLVRGQRARGRRGAAPARAGRACTGRRRSAPSTVACRERAALFDESSFAKLEIAGPGAAAFLEWLCDNRVARDVGRSPTRRCSTPAAGSSATSRSRAWRRSSSRSSPAPRSATTTWRGSAATRREDGSVRVTDVTSRWACFALWGPRARDILAPLTPDPLDFGYMTMRDSPSATCRCARCA